MKTIYECSMSKSLKWLSIAFIILIFASIVALLYDMCKGGSPFNAIGVILLFFVMLSVFCLYPQYVIATDEGIGIHTLIRTKWIKYDNIETIMKADLRGSIRICGIGGSFGWIGLFRSSKIGKYLSYVTDTTKAFIINRKNGIPVVISVDDPDSFLPYFLKS